MKVLIVKLSSLGDVVHAMPAVQDILRTYPEAQIDWVVERGFAPLVRRCAGVHRVIQCDLRKWRKTPFAAPTRQAWRAFKADLQQAQYDAVIDLQGLSKSALIAWLARLAPEGKRYGLANRTEGSSFEAPARWVAQVAITVPTHSHAVARSQEVCARALGYNLPAQAVYGLTAHLDHEACARDRADTPDASPAFPIVALVHGTSRADKQWPLAHWLALGQRLNDGGYAVALPHGNDEEERLARKIALHLTHAQVWPRLGLDDLTDALARCAGVIGVDSGLSHMAVALDLPHVQLYNFDTAWRTGPYLASARHQRSVFDRPTPAVEAVWQAWLTVSTPVKSA